MISSTWVDSAPLSLNASLSSEARTWSSDWNGKAIAAAISQAAMTTHLFIGGAVLQSAPNELPRFGGQKWVDCAVLHASEPHAGAVREVVDEPQRGLGQERDARTRVGERERPPMAGEGVGDDAA